MSDRSLGILFAIATACFWGVYGPALGFACSATNEWSPFKPYVFIGVAYLVWGVLGGIVAMKLIPATPDNFEFTGKFLPAMKWGFIAGSLGAFGALTLTFAVFKTKAPVLVMPIVFGGAVSVTAITSLLILKSGGTETHVSPLMWVGMALVAVGIVLVANNTPHGTPKKPAAMSTPDAAQPAPSDASKL